MPTEINALVTHRGGGAIHGESVRRTLLLGRVLTTYIKTFLTFSGEIHCVLLSHWRINYYFWKKYTLDPPYERFENSQFWCHFLSISNLFQNTSHKLYLQHIHMICDLNMSTLIADVPGLLEYCHLLKMLISFFKNNGS